MNVEHNHTHSIEQFHLYRDAYLSRTRIVEYLIGLYICPPVSLSAKQRKVFLDGLLLPERQYP